MPIFNTQISYGSISKFLHWFIAILIISMLMSGVSFGYISNENIKDELIFLHKSTGVLILALMLFRLLWRWINHTPAYSATISQWQKIGAHLIHYLIYIVAIFLPISGIIMSLSGAHKVSFYGLFNLPLIMQTNKILSNQAFNIHAYLAWTIFILISLHLLAALKHYFINKDDVFKRMLPAKRIS